MEETVATLWERNARLWIEQSAGGKDIHRDFLNTPAFMNMLPDVSGLKGVDIGCGDGYNTRIVATRGAQMVGIDLAESFIQYAVHIEKQKPLGITYITTNAEYLPFPSYMFDFATAFMSLMDMENVIPAILEVYRVLKTDAFFQFSIAHPCFDTPHRKHLLDQHGKEYALEIGQYFQQGPQPVSIKTASGQSMNIVHFHRTLSYCLNTLVKTGFLLEKVAEPYADEETIQKCPHLEHTTNVPNILIIRCKK